MNNSGKEFKKFETILIVDIQPHSEASNFFLGITKNISFEGFILESQNSNLKTGAILEFKLKHPNKDLSLTVAGEIIWEKETKYEHLAGVEFRRINEEIKSKISKLVSADEAVVTERDINKEDSEIIVSKTNNQIKTEEELQPDISRTPDSMPEQNRKSSVHKAAVLIAAIAIVASLSFVSWKSRMTVDPSALTASNDTAVEDLENYPEMNMHALPNAPDSGLPDVSKKSSSLTEPEEIVETEPPLAKQEPSLHIKDDIIVSNEENIQEIQSEPVDVSNQEDNTVHSEAANDNIPIYPENARKIQKPEKLDKKAGKGSQQPKENKQPKDFNRTRIIKYSAEPRKYFVQVGAWKNPDLAEKTLSELKKDHSEAHSFSKDDFQIIIIPDIPTKRQANTISKEIADKFDLKPLVAVIHKEGEIKSKLSNTDIPESEIVDSDLTSTDSKANAEQPVAEITAEPMIEAELENKNKTEIVRETNKPVNTPGIIIDPLDKDFITYEDFFDDNSNNWDIFDLEDASARIENGFYHIENKKDAGKLVILHFDQFPHDRDFIVETFINAASNSSDHFYGFVFGARDAVDNLFFQINNDGQYSVTKNHGGSSQELSGGQINSLSSDNNSLVSLKIAKLDNNTFFYINDNYVNKVSNLPFFGNKIGFVLEGSSVMAIDRTRSYIKQEKQTQ